MTQEEKVICYCRNMAVDAVIHFYAGELKQRGISFEYDMMLPQDIGISDTDLCKIYGNLLENAVDAVKEQKTEGGSQYNQQYNSQYNQQYRSEQKSEPVSEPVSEPESETQQRPYVKVLTRIKNKKLLIEISNTYSNEIQRKENRFYSTKHGGLGIGTASVMEVAQKNGGYAVFSAEEGIFKVNIFLPVKAAEKV